MPQFVSMNLVVLAGYDPATIPYEGSGLPISLQNLDTSSAHLRCDAPTTLACHGLNLVAGAGFEPASSWL